MAEPWELEVNTLKGRILDIEPMLAEFKKSMAAVPQKEAVEKELLDVRKMLTDLQAAVSKFTATPPPPAPTPASDEDFLNGFF